MINMTEKVPTRVHSGPFYKFLNCQKLAWIRLFFTCDPRNREVFELQTVLQCKKNLHVPSKRAAQVKNSAGPVAFSLCGPCKEHTEKEVSRKKNEGNGYGVRAVGTPIMVLLPDPSGKPDSVKPLGSITSRCSGKWGSKTGPGRRRKSSLVNPLNGLFW